MALPVVKKLPVLLIGKISTMNRKIKGIIILFFASEELVKYLLYNVMYVNKININKIFKKPAKPVSVKISK